MPSDISRHSTARLAGHPIHTVLAPIPFVCFLGTLVSDIVYWRTADMQWANFSAWLLIVGLIVSVVVVIAGLIDFVADAGGRRLGATWVHSAADGVALILAILDAMVHTRDAYTSVVPEGLILSALVVLIFLVTGWNDRKLGWRAAGSRPDAWR